MSKEDFIKKLDADIVTKGIELKTLLKLKADLLGKKMVPLESVEHKTKKPKK